MPPSAPCWRTGPGRPGLRVAFRHFPVRSKHPRAWAAACAAEAAALQGRFWEMRDALFSDQGRLEDPHLWARAERLGLDLARFEADRRSEGVAARVRSDFEGGIRAGVVTTPTVAIEGSLHGGGAAVEAVEDSRFAGRSGVRCYPGGSIETMQGRPHTEGAGTERNTCLTP